MQGSLNAIYGRSFYQRSHDESASSARVCVPLINDLLHPKSVIDVGCGIGQWLAEVAAQGITDFQGVDGPHVADDQLLIPREHFARHDLTRPLNVGRRFDVAMSLEVAEHLPGRVASHFVASLVALAPAVVFSAAVPGQGGVCHVNEQWPWYWKELFHRHGYVQLDPFRRIIWNNSEVAVYYRHNLFLYVDPAVHQDVIDLIGVPHKNHELTLVRTSILQELTKPGPVIRFWRRVSARLRRLLGWARPSP